MGSRILVVFGTATGTTREVAGALAEQLRAAGHETDVTRVEEAAGVDGYDGVIAGSPVLWGKANGKLKRFLRKHRKALAEKKLGCFLVCGFMNDPTDENRAKAEKCLNTMVRQVPKAQPVGTAMFGGAIKLEGEDFERMSGLLRKLTKAVSKDMKDGRDWDAIRAWGDELATKLSA